MALNNEIQNWSYSSFYEPNDIVCKDGKTYYSSKQIEENTNFSTENFKGYLDLSQGRPHFIWKPSFRSKYSNLVNNSINRFSEGNEKIIKSPKNNSFLDIDLVLENRDSKEAAAILHFLKERNGVESFFFFVPFPYNVYKIFLCKSWTNNLNYLNLNTINAKFEEKFN